MNQHTRTWIKDGLWAIVIFGLIASILRFKDGLGAVTGLNDSAPWGLWIAFKLVFVALAGGGFTLAAIVHIFHLERYHPLLRRAILIALLGYGSFIISLIFDLGLPWHIYMPVISWQHHSVMFEIAWCVMLYFSVLVLEFSPVILEHPLFNHRFYQTLVLWLGRATLPLIIMGIILSTLHQSSLGSLFMIMPHRVHPLWYSPWIPYMFFSSAIAAGMQALIVEGFLAGKWYKHQPDFDLLTRLGKWSMLPLGIYLALRLGDLFMRGVLPGAIDGSWQSVLFLAEILGGGILPIILLSLKRIRETQEGLLTSAVLVILGIMSQRMSLSMFTMFRAEGTRYLPSIGETAIAFAIPAAAVLLYLFFTENLQVYEKRSAARETESFTTALPGSPAFPAQNSSLRGVVSHRSGFAIFIIALALPVLSLRTSTPAVPVKPATGWETLKIDGNQSGYAVAFPHLNHQERLTKERGEAACRTCHHLDLPEDEASACSACHSDFYQPASIFNHNLHVQNLGGNNACAECHTGEHVSLSSAICQDCHDAMTPAEGQSAFNMLAPSYIDAMHGRCLSCHEVQAQELDEPELATCSTCHPNEHNESDPTE